MELLAPAGSPDAFYGAVAAGADAVYLGGSRFGARAYADNFTEEEIVACIKYGRLFDVKVYLTVNTLLRQRELEELPDFLEPFCRAGLAGVIVQDLGVLDLVRKAFPGLPLHASTQMTLCGSWGAELLKGMGVSRIVPARELSLEELKTLRLRTGMEVEAFVHGAMCYSYSGQCLFSSILGGRSGNRGRCAQPCRLPYQIRGAGKGREEYPLSLKDLCTIEHIPEMVEAGIDSFKIEGRMKKPEYAAGVTAVYRKYLDRYYELRERLGEEDAAAAYGVSPEDREELAGLYVRGELQDGYYFRRNGREMITLSSPAYSRTDEGRLKRIREDYLARRPRLPIDAEAELIIGKEASVIFRRGDVAARARGSAVQPAQNQPVTEEDLRRQLGKLGDSPFVIKELEIRLSGSAFYPLRQINELRRQAAEALERALLEKSLSPEERPNQSTERNIHRPDESIDCRGNRPSQSTAGGQAADGPMPGGGREAGLAVTLRTPEQLQVFADFFRIPPGEDRERIPLRYLALDGDLLLGSPSECFSVWGGIRTALKDERTHRFPELLAALPYVLREADAPYMERLWAMAERGEIQGFLVRSLDELGFLLEKERESGRRVRLRTDAGVYAWNTGAARRLTGMADGFCLPLELNAAEQRRLLEDTAREGLRASWEKIVYGRIPMMVTANCLRKTAGQCGKGGGEVLRLRDRFQTDFPVLCDCAHCVDIIYNSVPLALFGEQYRLPGVEILRFDFTVESGREMENVWKTWRSGGSLERGAYTTGHEKRGVE